MNRDRYCRRITYIISSGIGYGIITDAAEIDQRIIYFKCRILCKVISDCDTVSVCDRLASNNYVDVVRSIDRRSRSISLDAERNINNSVVALVSVSLTPT